MTYYEILKKHEKYGWCLERVHHNLEMAKTDIAKMRKAEPTAEFKIKENGNAWYDDKNWIG